MMKKREELSFTLVFQHSVRILQKTKEVIHLFKDRHQLLGQMQSLEIENEALKRNIFHHFDDIEQSNIPQREGRAILILGPGLSSQVIYGIAKDFHIEKGDLEIQDDYQRNKRFNVRGLQYSSRYRAVVVGPVAHKITGLDDHSSLIEMLKREPGYPRVYETRSKSGKLKITKTSLKEAFDAVEHDACCLARAC